jgi:hypothetical protein
MTTRALAVAAALLLAACPETTPPTELPVATDPPPVVVAACRLAARRCSRCHTLDRIFQARMRGPAPWQVYVHKMRLMPASGIPPEEEPELVRCMGYESLTDNGPAVLAREVGR